MKLSERIARWAEWPMLSIGERAEVESIIHEAKSLERSCCDFVAVFKSDTHDGQARSCPRCMLVSDAERLMVEPINMPSIAIVTRLRALDEKIRIFDGHPMVDWERFCVEKIGPEIVAIIEEMEK